MSEIVIRVEGLSKQYRIGGPQVRYRTFRDTVAKGITSPFRKARDLLRGIHTGAAGLTERFWALKDVSIEIKSGEVLGIIGKNGAGKTTLLKILSRITEPTEGYVDIYGRVGSLLEVGTGFHPELTGRENIFLNGAILGMNKGEINRNFDQIVSFAEIEKFIDTPVKHYSSGMYVRLAFAVAAHLEPEILLVDEVLAVGDADFQKKCLGKMGDVAKEGRTVLLVSHNMIAIQNLCDSVILLNDGEVIERGRSDQVVANYLRAFSSKLTQRIWDDIETAPGNQIVRLHRVSVRPENGYTSDPITMRTPFLMEFEYWNLVRDAFLNLNIHVITEQGVIAFASVPILEPQWHGRPFPIGLFRSRCFVPGDLLNSGCHRVRLRVVKDSRIIYEYEDALTFEVNDSPELRHGWYGKTLGTVRPLLKWTTELLKNESEINL